MPPFHHRIFLIVMFLKYPLYWQSLQAESWGLGHQQLLSEGNSVPLHNMSRNATCFLFSSFTMCLAPYSQQIFRSWILWIVYHSCSLHSMTTWSNFPTCFTVAWARALYQIPCLVFFWPEKMGQVE
jgi:hypothetical protein